MKRLRTEMIRLQAQAATSLQALHGRLCFMQGLASNRSLQLSNSWNRRQSQSMHADAGDSFSADTSENRLEDSACA